MTKRGSIGPSSDSWVAAVYASPGDFTPLGAAVVIDDWRVLTCAHVVASKGTVRDELWVGFPKAELATNRRRVASVAVSGGRTPIIDAGARIRRDDDVAVLHLGDRVPSTVTAAALKCPEPGDLVGLQWWAFGFPVTYPRGNAADGVIGAALTQGWVRVDAESRYHVEPGFSGSGLWSPDYDAVVAIVSEVNDRGDGQAITLNQADALLPDENLRLLAEQRSAAGTMQLTIQPWLDHSQAALQVPVAARSTWEREDGKDAHDAAYGDLPQKHAKPNPGWSRRIVLVSAIVVVALTVTVIARALVHPLRSTPCASGSAIGSLADCARKSTPASVPASSPSPSSSPSPQVSSPSSSASTQVFPSPSSPIPTSAATPLTAAQVAEDIIGHVAGNGATTVTAANCSPDSVLLDMDGSTQGTCDLTFSDGKIFRASVTIYKGDYSTYSLQYQENLTADEVANAVTGRQTEGGWAVVAATCYQSTLQKEADGFTEVACQLTIANNTAVETTVSYNGVSNPSWTGN